MMYSSLQTAYRGIRLSLQWIARIRYMEYLLFIAIICCKLTLFDRYTNIPYMRMESSDYYVAIGSILVCSFWVVFLPLRGRLVSLFLLNVFMSTLIYADLIYYRYFKDFISVPVLLQAGQVGALGDSISSLLAWKDLYFFADLALLLPLLIFACVSIGRRRRQARTFRFFQKSGRGKLALRVGASVVILLLGVSFIYYPITKATSTWAKGLFVGNWWNVSLYNVTGLIGFHGYDLYRYADEHWLSKPGLSEERAEDIRAWFAANKQRPQPRNELFGAYRNKNVLVIQAEAFQNFVIGRQIGGKEITPHLNALIRDSMYFSNYYHQTGQGRTSDAEFTSAASLHPLPTGSVFTRYPGGTFDSLPRILKEQGYETGAYHAYEASFWNRYNMYANIGYDRFYSKKDFKIDEPLGWSLADASFMRQSLDFMDQSRQPFYSFLITLSSHHPYSLPPERQLLDVGELKGTMFGDYLQAVHYVDDAVGQLIAQMKERGLWGQTIFVFYGDHDNSIAETEPLEQLLGRTLSELDLEQIRNQVPMIVHLPDGSHAGTYEQAGGQLDMAPSLLYLLGIPRESYYMMGNNLFTPEPKTVILRSGAATDGKRYYKPAPDGNFEHGACYDLTTRTQTDTAACRSVADKAKEELNISDQVIMHNLIAQFRRK